MPGDDILNRIFERLGGIDEKLKAGSQRHAEFAQSFAEFERKVDSLADRVGKVEHLAERVSIIEPTLWELEGKRFEKLGQKKLITDMFKVSHAVYAGGVVVIGWLAAHTPYWPWK